MNLLLDTHIWIWSHLQRRKLSTRVVRAIDDPRNVVWVSPISTWEITLLCERGRLQLEDGPQTWIEKTIALAGLREAPLTHEIALATCAIGLPHADPFDRLLAATALVHDFTLITADENLARARQISFLINR